MGYKIYLILIGKGPHKKLGNFFSFFILLLIFLSLALTIIEIVGIPQTADNWFEIIEYITVGIFAIEWFLHFFTAQYFYPEAKSIWHARWKWISSYSSIIDIICVLTMFTNFLPESSPQRKIKILKLSKALKIYEYIWFIKEGE